jgi:hypothetical protein
LLSLIVYVGIQQIHKLLVLLLNLLYGLLELPYLLTHLILRQGLLTQHAVQPRDLILLLVDRPPQVLALIVQLIEPPLEVLILGLPLAQLILMLPHHLVPLPGQLLDRPLLLHYALLLRPQQVLQVPYPGLLPEHLPLKLRALRLLALDEALHVLHLRPDLVQPRLILDALLVQHGVVMLQVLILLTLVCGLLIELLRPILQGRDGPAEVRAVPAGLVEGGLQVTRLLHLDGEGAL